MYLLNNQAIISLHKYLLQAPTYGGGGGIRTHSQRFLVVNIRLELIPDTLCYLQQFTRDRRATFTLLPNIVGGPDLPWAAAMPTTLACRRILASGIS